MSSRSNAEACRICGGELQGNHRRWLFASQNKKGQSLTLNKDSNNRLSSSRSAHSSPWGSTLSLGSSHLLSKSHTLPTPSKGMDLLSVLTHILGRSVTRDQGLGEFICGKCVSVLERVFKFDTVIARVRVLSRERLQKLTQERDNLSHWMQNVYRQRHPSEFRSRASSSEDDVEFGEGHGNSGRAYRDMLRDNMSLSAYECWSEKSDSCPYFKRTGKRCNKLKNCDCCDSLRVSDSDYESVCGIPRHLPDQLLSPSGLSRDKSQSMPLHWSRVPSVSSSPASLAGSCLSLRSRSRTVSAQSLDSLDGPDPFDWPEEQVNLASVLHELKGIEGKPVRSPAGSRIPVLGRAQGQNSAIAGGSPKAGLVHALKFGDGHDQDGESEDVLMELRDEFLPFHREVTAGRVNLADRQFRDKLDQAHARIRTLEAGLRDSIQSCGNNATQSVHSPEVNVVSSSVEEDGLIHHLNHSLQSRERVIQECVTLIQKLCVELGAGLEETDKLISKVTVTLTDAHTEREGVLEAQLAEVKERESSLQKELEALRQAGRERERDLITLNTVLQSNQDIITYLRVELAERTQSIQDVQKEKEIWKERDTALQAVLREKDLLISRLQEALESSRKDVQALSDSLIGRGLSGGGAEDALVCQVKEQKTLLATCLKDWEEHAATMSLEVSKLSSALEKAESAIQSQRQSHQQALADLTDQLRHAHKELREMVKATKQSGQMWSIEKSKRDLEERKLKGTLQKRDKIIEQVLLDAEKRDSVLIELHQSISSKLEPRIALKHTL